jgi:hypothetical protein
MLAIVMLRETIKGNDIGPFDEWSPGKTDYIKKETQVFVDVCPEGNALGAG